MSPLGWRGPSSRRSGHSCPLDRDPIGTLAPQGVTWSDIYRQVMAKRKRHPVREHERKLPSGKVVKVRRHMRGGKILLVFVAIAAAAGAVLAVLSQDDAPPEPAPPLPSTSTE